MVYTSPVPLGTVSVGGVNTPLAHTPSVNVGVATGVTGMQLTSANTTAKVASVAEVRVQPGGSVAGQPTPVPRKVAVTVTESPGAYGPPGAAW